MLQTIPKVRNLGNSKQKKKKKYGIFLQVFIKSFHEISPHISGSNRCLRLQSYSNLEYGWFLPEIKKKYSNFPFLLFYYCFHVFQWVVHPFFFLPAVSFFFFPKKFLLHAKFIFGASKEIELRSKKFVFKVT